MPKKRKEGNVNTTMSLSWSDKNRLRRLGRKIKTTKNGDVYEADSVIVHRIIEYYYSMHPSEVKSKTTSTYPLKNQGEARLGYSLVESSSV